MTTSGARYPLHEIESRLGWPTKRYLADQLGVSIDVVVAWRHRGLSHKQADRVAIAMDLHPAIVWPDWINNERHDGPVQRPARLTPPIGAAWHHSRHEDATRHARTDRTATSHPTRSAAS